MSTEEFEQWSVWETTPAGGVVVHTPADMDHERCDCGGGPAAHEDIEWAREKAEEIRATGSTAVIRRRTQTWIEGPWLEPGTCPGESALAPRRPTSEECVTGADVDGWRAFWFPQMGGYVGKALAKAGECCVDVWVWHNGRFPFDGDCHNCGEERQPVRLHMDDGHEWRALGEFLDALTDESEPAAELRERSDG